MYPQFGALNLLASAFRMVLDPNTDLTDHSGVFDDGLRSAKANKCIMALDVALNSKIFFYVCAGDFKAAIHVIDERNSLNVSLHKGSILESWSLYVDGLSFFGLSRRTKDVVYARELVRRGRECVQRLRPYAARNPAVALSKLVLLEAENAAVGKSYSLAEEKYDHAAGIAQRYRNAHELAFAKNFAAEYYINDVGDANRALSCFEDACSAYEGLEWHAVISQIKRKIASLQQSG